MKDKQLEMLLKEAKKVQKTVEFSKHVKTTGVACALLTKDGNVCVGCNIETDCDLGMCAERAAIATMLTVGENEIVKLVCIGLDNTIWTPCGACREFLMQLSPNNKDMIILVDEKTEKTVTLSELLPMWWD